MRQATPNPRRKSALLLGGGGARAAYQVGVLKAVSELTDSNQTNPFPIICGTGHVSDVPAGIDAHLRKSHSCTTKQILGP